jgi:hypothetical protein
VQAGLRAGGDLCPFCHDTSGTASAQGPAR